VVCATDKARVLIDDTVSVLYRSSSPAIAAVSGSAEVITALCAELKKEKICNKPLRVCSSLSFRG
jgi:hypothetical protein